MLLLLTDFMFSPQRFFFSSFFFFLPSTKAQRNGIIVKYTLVVSAWRDSNGLPLDQNQTLDLDGSEWTATVGNLSAFSLYSATLRAFTDAGGSPFAALADFARTGPAAPGVPLSVAAFASSGTAVRVFWQTPVPANGVPTYTVAYWPQADPSARLETTGTNALNTTISGLAPLTEYSFSVRAGNGDSLLSPWSEPANASTTQDRPADAPASLTATALSPTAINVTWQPVSVPNGQIVMHVVQFRNTFTSNPATSINVSSPDLSVVLSGLVPFNLYDISVSASTSVGAGPPASVQARPLAAPASGAPLQVRMERRDATSLFVTYQPPELSLQGGTISGYSVSYWPTADGTQAALTVTVSDPNVTLTGLRSFTNYSAAVAAINEAGEGVRSAAVTLRTGEALPASAVTNLAVSAQTNTSLTLSWSASLSGVTNGVVLGFAATFVRNSAFDAVFNGVPGEVSSLVAAANATSVTISGLEPAVLYDVNVTVFNAIGLSVLTQSVSGTTLDGVPSLSPPNLRVTSTSASNISLAWDPVPIQNRRGTVLSYRIVNLQQPPALTTNDTSITVTGLLAARDYQFSVSAITVAGTGPATTPPLLARTAESTPTGAPTNVQGVAVADDTIQLSWAPPTPESQNGVILGYKLFVSQGNGTAVLVAAGNFRRFKKQSNCQVGENNEKRKDKR